MKNHHMANDGAPIREHVRPHGFQVLQPLPPVHMHIQNVVVHDLANQSLLPSLLMAQHGEGTSLSVCGIPRIKGGNPPDRAPGREGGVF